MNNIWLEQQLDLRMVTFRCLPTGNRKGLIELVPDCCTLREIQIASGVTGVIKDDVLNDWLLRKNPSEFQYKAVRWVINYALSFNSLSGTGQLPSLMRWLVRCDVRSRHRR